MLKGTGHVCVPWCPRHMGIAKNKMEDCCAVKGVVNKTLLPTKQRNLLHSPLN